MKRVLAVATGVAVLGLCALLAWLNPGMVDVRFSPQRSLQAPLGWLLVFAFAGGVLVAAVGASLQQLGRRIAGWRERRRARQAVQATRWQQNGAALAWDGELEKGRSLLRKAWRRQPHNSAAALALASSFMDTGEYGAARQVLAEAVARDANDADLRCALGEVLRRSGETAEAIRMLETIRVQHPRAPRALLLLRELYRETGNWTEAARVQDAYLRTLRDSRRAPVERERLLRLRYQAATAIENPAARADALAAVAQEDRAFVPAVVSLGDALVAAERTEEAKKVWERAFKHTPRLVFIERLLDHSSSTRERQRLVALMKKFAQQLDADAMHLLAAQAALRDGQVDTAATELQAIGRQQAPAVQRQWAEVHRRRGQLEQALESLSRAANGAEGFAAGYRCTSCGRPSSLWSGYCRDCDRWDTYRATAEASGATRQGPSH